MTISSRSKMIRSGRVAPDPFRFGWREVRRQGSDGEQSWERIPLTPEDLLHPQENDTIPENTVHEEERDYLAGVFRSRVRHRPKVRVFSDCLINWGVKGLRNHSPDISVFDKVADLKKKWKTFPAAKQKARPLLAVEIVSPDEYSAEPRDNDVVIKKEHYHRVGVPLYFIVDQEEDDGPRTILGFRNTKKGYVALQPDDQGRLFIEPLNLLIGLKDERVVCYDPDTGKELHDHADALLSAEAARQSLQATEQSLQAAEERIRQLEAENQRLRALKRNGSSEKNGV